MIWSLTHEFDEERIYPSINILCPPSNQKDICDPDGRFGLAFMGEVIVSFQFVLVNLSCMYNPSGNMLAHGLHNFCYLYASILFGNKLSGASLNPAAAMA